MPMDEPFSAKILAERRSLVDSSLAWSGTSPLLHELVPFLKRGHCGIHLPLGVDQLRSSPITEISFGVRKNVGLVSLGVKEMSERAGGSPTLDLALERYKQGKCPCCGKSRREPRGLEYRRRTHDLYCHSCKRRWPMEFDLAGFQQEFSVSIPSVPDVRRSEALDLSPHRKSARIQSESRGWRRLLRRIVLRH